MASRAYPKLFFKPLFACAAANKDATVVRQLSVLGAITKFMPEFWMRDPDMMSVALMSDISGSKHPSDRESAMNAKPRIGQLVLAVELAERLQMVRQVKDLSVVSARYCRWVFNINDRNVVIKCRKICHVFRNTTWGRHRS